MLNCKNSSDRQKSCEARCAVMTSFAVVALSFTIITWIVSSQKAEGQTNVERVKEVRSTLEETRDPCKTDQNIGCNSTESKTNGAISPSCLKTKTVHSRIRNDVNNEFNLRERGSSINANIEGAAKDLLFASVGAFYRPRRTTMHWVVLPRSAQSSGDWVTIREFDKNRATYTVSVGPMESSQNGVMVIPDGGLYKVYAKLTFNCAIVNTKDVRITMELVLHDHRRPYPTTLLRNVEDVSCAMVGDVATMYLEGFFKIPKKSTILLRYKAPSHIVLSRDQNQAYKSYMGAYYLGVA